MGSRSRTPEDINRLIGKVLVEDLPKRVILPIDIKEWLKKYGCISDIFVYPRCVLVQFKSDLEAAGAVQCENGASFFGTKVTLRHIESNDIRNLRRNESFIDSLHNDTRKHPIGYVNYELDRHRNHFRDKMKSPEHRHDSFISKYSRSLTSLERCDRRTVHPLNWLSEVASGIDKTDNRNGLILRDSINNNIDTNPNVVPHQNGKIPYIVAIIAMQHDLVPYAEIIEKRVSNLLDINSNFLLDPSISKTHIVVLLSIDHLVPCLTDLTNDRVPFAIVCTMTNWTHNSCTVRILYAPTQQEHRNMPLDNAWDLLTREFSAYNILGHDRNLAASEDSTFIAPSRHLSSLLRMLSDSRVLSIGELDEIVNFVQERKRLLVDKRESQHIDVDQTNANQTNANQTDLKTKILSMLYPKTSNTCGTSVAITAASLSFSNPIKTNISSAHKLVENFSNPLVQNAINTLISYPSSVGQNIILNSANFSMSTNNLTGATNSGYGMNNTWNRAPLLSSNNAMDTQTGAYNVQQLGNVTKHSSELVELNRGRHKRRGGGDGPATPTASCLPTNAKPAQNWGSVPIDPYGQHFTPQQIMDLAHDKTHPIGNVVGNYHCNNPEYARPSTNNNLAEDGTRPAQRFDSSSSHAVPYGSYYQHGGYGYQQPPHY